MMRRLVVIGGGITGLAAAWRLKQTIDAKKEPVSLLLLEASSRVGGSIQSEIRDGFLLEHGPDCFISDKPAAVELARELGLEKELLSTRPEDRRSFILREGQLHPVPEGFYLIGPSKLRPFLESSLVGWKSKWRTLLEPLVTKRRGPACRQAGAEESLGAFVRRRFGQEMLDWFAQPLLGGIYGADPERLSLRATFPQFQEMEDKYGSVLLGLNKRSGLDQASGARYSLFLTLRRGMQTLTDELERRLGETVIRKNAKVMSLSRSAEATWDISLANGEKLSADGVILALPSFACAKLIQSWDVELAEDLAGISSAPAATLNIAFREMDVPQKPSGAGFVVPRRENKTLIGCTFVQNKFEGRVPKGFVLLRAFMGGVFGRTALEKSDDALTRQTLDEVRPILKIKANPMFTSLARYSEGLPQYNIGHIPRILRIEDRILRHKNLRLAGNWSRGVGIPDCIRSANQAASA